MQGPTPPHCLRVLSRFFHRSTGRGVAQEQESTLQEWVRAPIKWVRAPMMMGAHPQGWGRAPIRWGRALLEKGLFQKCHNEL